MNLRIAGNELYIPEYFNDRIQVFGLDGAPKRIIGGKDDGPGQFNAPGGVAVAPNGDLFVADFYNHRVQHLRADGGLVRQLGTTGKTSHAAGEFIYPTDATLGPDGTLYVADGYGNRIQVFDSEGRFLRKWGGPLARGIYGPFNGWVTTVTSVAVDRRGNVFAADFLQQSCSEIRARWDVSNELWREGQRDGAVQSRHCRCSRRRRCRLCGRFRQ